MSRFKKWAQHEYSKKQRIVALFLQGIFYGVAILFFLVVTSLYIDEWFHLPKFAYGLINPVIAMLFVGTGLIFAIWAIQVQFSLGQGTPSPRMPTRKLVVQGPYTYCRNPMTLGTVILYLGISIWTGSISAVVLALIFASFLTVYNKMIEERELEKQFGSEYLEYKKRTPFLVPRLWKRKIEGN